MYRRSYLLWPPVTKRREKKTGEGDKWEEEKKKKNEKNIHHPVPNFRALFRLFYYGISRFISGNRVVNKSRKSQTVRGRCISKRTPESLIFLRSA